MVRTVLVPLDGSTYAQHALPAARSIAQRTRATVILTRVHTLDTVGIADDGRAARGMDEQTDARQRRRAMNSLTARCFELVAADVDAGCTLLDGPVVPTLVEHAREQAVDLVVMTTHGRGAFSRAWLGSVVDGFVRRCPIPTLLVRPPQATESVPPLVDQPWDVRRVLVPLDGSELAEHILEPAAALAEMFGADVLLLRVVAPRAEAGPLDPPTQTAPDTQAAEQRYVEDISRKLRARDLTVRVRIEPADHVARAILDVARKERCDVIALATHGRGGLARIVIGSVADKVVRGAEQPVLVFRP